jgi:hypothetical protein
MSPLSNETEIVMNVQTAQKIRDEINQCLVSKSEKSVGTMSHSYMYGYLDSSLVKVLSTMSEKRARQLFKNVLDK